VRSLIVLLFHVQYLMLKAQFKNKGNTGVTLRLFDINDIEKEDWVDNVFKAAVSAVRRCNPCTLGGCAVAKGGCFTVESTSPNCGTLRSRILYRRRKVYENHHTRTVPTMRCCVRSGA